LVLEALAAMAVALSILMRARGGAAAHRQFRLVDTIWTFALGWSAPAARCGRSGTQP